MGLIKDQLRPAKIADKVFWEALYDALLKPIFSYLFGVITPYIVSIAQYAQISWMVGIAASLLLTTAIASPIIQRYLLFSITGYDLNAQLRYRNQFWLWFMLTLTSLSVLLTLAHSIWAKDLVFR